MFSLMFSDIKALSHELNIDSSALVSSPLRRQEMSLRIWRWAVQVWQQSVCDFNQWQYPRCGYNLGRLTDSAPTHVKPAMLIIYLNWCSHVCHMWAQT